MMDEEAPIPWTKKHRRLPYPSDTATRCRLLHAKAKTVITTYYCHFHINGYYIGPYDNHQPIKPLILQVLCLYCSFDINIFF